LFLARRSLMAPRAAASSYSLSLKHRGRAARSVPLSLKSRLDEIAKQERRSLSKQVELLLEECLELRDRDRERISPPTKDSRRRKD